MVDDNGSSEHQEITKRNIDKYFEFLLIRSGRISEYIKDKEKKKLWIVGGSYAVFTLVTTVMVNILTKYNNVIETMIALPSIVLFTLFVIGVVLIYTSIIKHILALKADCVLATRQLNCLRQSINSVVYSYVEGKYPIYLNLEGGQDSVPKGSILDKNSKYWRYYGEHEKYPLDNLSFRSVYDKKSIYFRSVDIYSVVIIAIFTSLLIMTPFGFFLAHINDGSEKYTVFDGMLLGGISVLSLIAFLTLVGATIYVDMKRIRTYLKAGQPFNSE